MANLKTSTIAIFSGFYSPHTGGVERYTDKLAGALEDIGYNIVIVTSNNDNLKTYEKIGQRSIYRLPILNLASKRYPIPRLNSEYNRTIKRIKQENIDYFIVNTRFYLTSLIGARLGHRNRKPVILIEHGTGHFTVGNKLLDYFGHNYEHFLTSLVKKNVDRFYGVSKSCNKWLKHFAINGNGVFYNSINKKESLGALDRYAKSYPKDEIIITYAGRLIAEKGVLNLLDAFGQLNSRKLDRKVRLVVAGDGPLLNKIKEKYDDDNIDIVGRLDFNKVMSLYKRTDIFVYPSLYPEGLPTSILEAGLMNCAVIATPKGGTEEVMIDNNYGVIVDGSVRSLSKAINRLVNDDRLRRQLADNIHKRIRDNFDWANTAATVEKELKMIDLKK